MNYKDAVALRNKYEHLVETSYKGREISALLIAPDNHDRIGEIIMNYGRGLECGYIYENYTNFDVVVIFDYPDFIARGILTKDSLINILPNK